MSDGIRIADYGRDVGPPVGYDGPVWTTEELQRDFEVHSFTAPFARVTRKSDGVHGSLEFTHQPRMYFDFRETR